VNKWSRIEQIDLITESVAVRFAWPRSLVQSSVHVAGTACSLVTDVKFLALEVERIKSRAFVKIGRQWQISDKNC